MEHLWIWLIYPLEMTNTLLLKMTMYAINIVSFLINSMVDLSSSQTVNVYQKNQIWLNHRKPAVGKRLKFTHALPSGKR